MPITVFKILSDIISSTMMNAYCCAAARTNWHWHPWGGVTECWHMLPDKSWRSRRTFSRGSSAMVTLIPSGLSHSTLCLMITDCSLCLLVNVSSLVRTSTLSLKHTILAVHHLPLSLGWEWFSWGLSCHSHTTADCLISHAVLVILSLKCINTIG